MTPARRRTGDDPEAAGEAEEGDQLEGTSAVSRSPSLKEGKS
jgi:hypothetical protein